MQGLSFTDPNFRGCAFVSASAQAPPGSIDEETTDYRAWVHQLFYDLAQQAGAKDPKSGKQLVVLYDGAGPRSQRRNRRPRRRRGAGRRRDTHQLAELGKSKLM